MSVRQKKPYVRKDGTIGKTGNKIDKRLFEDCCNTMCTQEEICGILHCSDETLRQWCLQEYGEGYLETRKHFCYRTKKNLRKIQLEQAKTNPTMAIWLGKQYLGQTDKVESTNMERVQIVSDIPIVDDEETPKEEVNG